VVQAAMRESVVEPTVEAQRVGNDKNQSVGNGAAPAATTPLGGTVVLDVEQGGIEVPSFVGKTVRRALETAQDAGLELQAMGSGVARTQSPPPGTHVHSGAQVKVQFGR